MHIQGSDQNHVVCSIVTDVIDGKLEMAKKMGADVVINSKNNDLRTAGISLDWGEVNSSVRLKFIAVLSETNNDGAGRIVEATGFSPLVNSSFSMLRY